MDPAEACSSDNERTLYRVAKAAECETARIPPVSPNATASPAPWVPLPR
jgi:hypothetical protein